MQHALVVGDWVCPDCDQRANGSEDEEEESNGCDDDSTAADDTADEDDESCNRKEIPFIDMEAEEDSNEEHNEMRKV